MNFSLVSDKGSLIALIRLMLKKKKSFSKGSTKKVNKIGTVNIMLDKIEFNVKNISCKKEGCFVPEENVQTTKKFVSF